MQFCLICTNTDLSGGGVLTPLEEIPHLCSVGKPRKLSGSPGCIYFDRIVLWFVLEQLGKEVDRDCL